MGKLTRSVLISLVILALSVPAMAAQVTITFDEPTAAGNDCKELRVYWCYGADCNPRTRGITFPASSPSCGQLDRTLVFDLKIPQNRVPGQMCFRVTVVNDADNESTGVTSCVPVTGS